MSAHARLSPSGSKKWMACAGSLALEAPFPNLPSEHSDNGTACHTVAAECLRSPELRPSDWLMDRVRVNDEGEPDRFVEFTDDLCTMTTGYVDEIKALTKDRELFVEQRVEFSEYVDVPDQFGTIDAFWLEPFGLRDQWQIVICDLKTGYKWVGTDSPQLKCYALGVLSRFELSHEIHSVRLMIYQPRHGGMREEVISLDELREFAVLLKEKAQRVEQATADHAQILAEGALDTLKTWEVVYLNPNPNEEECAFCRAMSTCPAARAKLESVVGANFDVITEPGHDQDVIDSVKHATDDLGHLMSITEFLEDWIKAVRAEVERRLMLGEPVKGYGLELGRQGARAWTDKAAVEELVRKKFRIKAELAYKMELHSPTQLEKLAKVTAPTKKNPNPAKPVISPAQWAKLQPLIVRSDAVPSVKPADRIKEPYSVVKADESAFDVEPETKPEEDTLW